MSTDHQKYSIDNQADAIATYAALNQYEIVRSYIDAGRSGLHIEGGGALQQLLEDVRSGAINFATVLVYDVSRWGRFQDVDESAHYEFICKRSGVTVQYCAEQFGNNGTLLATIAKNMKRAMAAEFSRELSVKVLEGQKRLSRLGFRRGGTPGYGLRRLLVDENRRPKAVLQFGEQKHLHTDRIILTPGPPEEIGVVRTIFRWFVQDQIAPTHIARRLNEKRIPNAIGHLWTTNNVFKVLKNESYIGNLVFNRTTSKLSSKRRPNPRHLWIKAEGAFASIVDRQLFAEAQATFRNRWTFTDGELLNYLTAMLCTHGRLSSEIIRTRKCGPSISTYYMRFGKLSNAFGAIGYRCRTAVHDPSYTPDKAFPTGPARDSGRHHRFRYGP